MERVEVGWISVKDTEREGVTVTSLDSDRDQGAVTVSKREERE